MMVMVVVTSSSISAAGILKNANQASVESKIVMTPEDAFPKGDPLLEEYQNLFSPSFMTKQTGRNLRGRRQNQDEPVANVAIIGAGPTGLFMAKLLRDKNISVMVFEQNDRVGGVAQTIQVKNKYYDVATMYVPKGGLWGYGVEPCMQEMIAVADDSQMEDSEIMRSFNGTVIPETLLSILEPFSTPVIIDQLVRQWAFYSCRLMGECGYVDLASPLNFQTNIMQRVSSFVVDFLRGASEPVRLRVPFDPNFVPSAVVSLLWSLGVRADTLPSFAPPSLKSFFLAQSDASAPFHRFVKGYGNFFKAFGRQLLDSSDKVRILLQSNVTQMNFDNVTRSWELLVQQKNKLKSYAGFTHVIAATGSLDRTIALMNSQSTSGELKAILAGAAAIDDQNLGKVYLADITNDVVLPSDRKIVINPSEKHYGDVNVDLSPVGFILRRYASDTRLVLGSNSNGLSMGDWYAAMRAFMKSRYGLDVAEQPIFGAEGGFPSVFIRGTTSSFIVNVMARQNINGFLVAGQGVVGSGVPGLCRHAMQMVATYF